MRKSSSSERKQQQRQPENSIQVVTVSVNDSNTDCDESGNGRLSYNKEEWARMRSPRKSQSRVSFEDEDRGSHLLLARRQQEQLQQLERLERRHREMLLNTSCLPSLPSPIDWLKKSLRSHSPGFLWQAQAAQGRPLFSDSDEDDDEQEQEQRFDPLSPAILSARQARLPRLPLDEDRALQMSTHSSCSSSSEVLVDIPPPPSPECSDTRIISPHVELLSLGSVVEVRVVPSPQSCEEQCVAVLCSVDVLKMQSRVLQGLLQAQEVEASERNTPTPLDEVWRESLVLRDEAPFEAAAFLENLHETKSIARDDWNLVWARLSVEWDVRDYRANYSDQVARHLSLVLGAVEQLHWRLRPAVLLGRSVAVLVPSSNSDGALPVTRLGRVIHSSASALPHSCVLVNFEVGGTCCSSDELSLSDTTDASEDDSFLVRPTRSQSTVECEDVIPSSAPPKSPSQRRAVAPARVSAPAPESSASALATGSAASSRPSRVGLPPPRRDSSSPFHSFADCLDTASPLSTPREGGPADRRVAEQHAAAPVGSVSVARIHSSDSSIAEHGVRLNSSRQVQQQQQQQQSLCPAASGSSGLRIPPSDAATCCQEPFWVLSSSSSSSSGEQSAQSPGSSWEAPDVFSQRLLDRAISAVDKQVFWEMLHALCAYPSLGGVKSGSGQGDSSGEEEGQEGQEDEGDGWGGGSPSSCVSRPRTSEIGSQSRGLLQRLLNPRELAALLSRVECRVLWTESAVQLVPGPVLHALLQVTFAPACSASTSTGTSIARTISTSSRRPPQRALTDLRSCGGDSSSRAAAAAHVRRHTIGSVVKSERTTDL